MNQPWAHVKPFRRSPSGCARIAAALRKATLLALGGVLLTAAGPAQTDQIHIVRWGETLNSIARRYHVEQDVLRDKNKLRNPNHIEAGTRLVIPDRKVDASPQSTPTAKLAATAEPRPEAPVVVTPKPASPTVTVSKPAAPTATAPKPKPVAQLDPTPVTRTLPVPTVIRNGGLSTSQTLQLAPGQSQLLHVQGATRVQIDDASSAVADVQPLSTRELLILGKGPGTTHLRVWDERGLYNYEIHVSAPMADLSAQITRAIGNPTILARQIQDTILLEGRAADKAESTRAERLAAAFVPKVVNLLQVADAPAAAPAPALAEQVRAALNIPGVSVEGVPGNPEAIVLRGVVPAKEDIDRLAATAGLFSKTVVNLLEIARPEQVRVQVRMVDVDRNALKELGVNWSDSATWGQDQPGGSFSMLTSISAELKALQTDNTAHTLAAPSLLVSSGESGRIVIGGQIPIPMLFTGYTGSGTTTAGSGVPQSGSGAGGVSGLLGQSVQFMDFGVKLDLSPTVEQGDEIALKLGAEVSALDRTTAVTINGSTIPGLSTKRTETTFRIKDGQTLVIGGLISNEDAKAVQKFPILADIPVLGQFFRSVKNEKTERELVIFVTPELAPKEETSAAGQLAVPHLIDKK